MVCWYCQNPIILVDVKDIRLPEKIQKYRSDFKKYLIFTFVSIPIMAVIYFFIPSSLKGYLFPVMLLPMLLLIPAFYGLIKWTSQKPKYIENLISKYPPPNPSDCPRVYDFHEGLGSVFKYCPFCKNITPIDADFCQDCGKDISDKSDSERNEKFSIDDDL